MRGQSIYIKRERDTYGVRAAQLGKRMVNAEPSASTLQACGEIRGLFLSLRNEPYSVLAALFWEDANRGKIV